VFLNIRMKTRIYRSFSVIQFYAFWSLNVLFLSLLSFSIYNFELNDVLFSILIGFSILCLFGNNIQVIEIYQDRLILKRIFALGLFSKNKSIEFHNVKEIKLSTYLDAKTYLKFAIFNRLSKIKLKPHLNSIFITNLDNTITEFETGILAHELKRAFKEMIEKSEYAQTMKRNQLVNPHKNKV